MDGGDRRALREQLSTYFREEIARVDACVAAYFDYVARIFPGVRTRRKKEETGKGSIGRT